MIANGDAIPERWDARARPEGFREEPTRMDHHGRVLGLALVAVLTGCGSGDAAKPTAAITANDPSPTPTIQDMQVIVELEGLASIEPGTYFIDPDLDPSTPLRVVYEVPEGWSSWIGAAKFSEEGFQRFSRPIRHSTAQTALVMVLRTAATPT